ncbi:hypothetical protein [Oribacterium sp.]
MKNQKIYNRAIVNHQNGNQNDNQKNTQNAKQRGRERNKQWKRAVCIALCFSQVLALSMSALAEVQKPRYHENYYALLSRTGEFKQGSLVREYETKGYSSLTDYGTYENVKNLSNSVAVQSNGNQHTLDLSKGNVDSLFLEGETAEPYSLLPWSIQIRYELNGLEVQPETLAGEKGLVKIHVQFTKNPNAQDYAAKNYVMMARSSFSAEDILSLKAEKAQVVSLGEKKEVIFVLLPGEEDDFTIEVGSNSFSFSGLQFQMAPLRSSQVEKITDLREAKEESEDSYHALKDAGNSILDSLDASQKSLEAMRKNINNSEALLRKTQEEGRAYQNSRDQIYQDMETVNNSISPLTGNVEDFNGLSRDAKNNISESQSNMNRLQNAMLELEDSLVALRGDVPSQTEIDKAQQSLSQVEALLSAKKQGSVQNSLANLSAKLEGSPLKDQIMAMVQEYISLQAEADSTEAEMQKLAMEKLNPALKEFSSNAHSGLTNSKESLSVLEDNIEDVKRLQETLKNYAEKGEETGRNLNTLLENSQKTMEDLRGSLQEQDAYLRGKREEAYASIENNLNATDKMLKSGEAVLDSTGVVRNAKGELEALVEKKWDENVGEKSSILEIDPNRPIESLMPSENDNIVDVAVTLRTEEIKEVKEEKVKTKETKEPSLWDRLGQVAHKVWKGITSIFKGGK